MAYRVNDFFCGAGGVGIGFQKAGFDVVWACDFDKYAVETYRNNVGDHVIQADVRKLTYADIPGAEVWAFGFPCQDLSVAGVRKGFCFKCSDCGEEFTLNDAEYSNGVKCPKCRGMRHTAASRSGMFFEVMRLLDETEENNPEKMPKVLMAENVKGLKQYIPVLEQEFQKRGYTAHVRLFNSKYWNVPQNRERYYIVGVKQEAETFVFPEEQHESVPKLSTVLDEVVNEKYYIPDEKARTIIAQALEKLDKLGKVHATLTPGRKNKRQNGPRSKPEEAEMFTLTTQDIHGVIIESCETADTVKTAICEESKILDLNGCGKTLCVGRELEQETQLSAHFSMHGIVADPSQRKREGKCRIYDNISPTLTARDYKEPRFVIVDKEDGNE